jgi:pimeloyl-ACP methyl ester carboxylesterase
VVGPPTPNIGPPPRRRADAVYDVRRWTVADRGLHFPAMENPDLYVEELRAFFRPLR